MLQEGEAARRQSRACPTRRRTRGRTSTNLDRLVNAFGVFLEKLEVEDAAGTEGSVLQSPVM